MSPQSSSLLTHVTHRAMACDFVVLLPRWQADRVETVIAALEYLDNIEADLSIYRPDGDVGRLNRLAATAPQRVRRSTFGLIRRAIELGEQCGGALDITAGPLIRAWGFADRRGVKPSAETIDAALKRVGCRYLQLDETELTVGFLRGEMEVNLGAIGKGHAIDQLTKRLRNAGLTDFLIHGGQSSVAAIGRAGEDDRGWLVGLSHPTKPTRRLTGIWLKDSALSTSGSGQQFFHHRGKRYGHVIDPRTGYPAGDLLSLTLIMPSATDADGLTTGLFVAGKNVVETLVAESQNAGQNIAAIAVADGGGQDRVNVSNFGEVQLADSNDQT